LADSVRLLVDKLQWTGIANIQAIVDSSREPAFYEINPRAAGSVGLNALADFDLLGGALEWAATGTSPWSTAGHGSPATVPHRVTFRRHWSTEGRAG
jgi:hypothetical protein